MTSVVVWGLGNVGRHAVRMIAARTDLRLAGVVTSRPDRAPDGCPVFAPDAVATVDCDVVVHCPLSTDEDHAHIVQLLSAGRNVVTTVGYVYPKAMGMPVLAELDHACAAGRSRLHGTGANPGFLADLLPVTLSRLCERVDSVLVREVSNFHRYPSAEIIHDTMGLGMHLDAYEHLSSGRYRRWLTGLFAESTLLLADALGFELDSLEVDTEVALSPDDLEIAAGPLPIGTVAAQRWTWEAMIGGSARIRLEAVYRAHPSVATEWGEPGGLVEIEGAPRISMPLAHRWLGDGLLATAARAVNAIGPMMTMPPGVITLLDLPVVAGGAR
jgi:2,4-diaminopentanoate dehydrogenase